MNSHELFLTLRDYFQNKKVNPFTFNVTTNESGNVVVTATAHFERSCLFSDIKYMSYNDVYYKNQDVMREVSSILAGTYEKCQKYNVKYVKYGMFDERLANALTTATMYYDTFFNNFQVKFFIELKV